MSSASDPTPDVLAEAAWRHLVNRHDLAEALDDRTATSDIDGRLLLAVDHLRSVSAPRPCAPAGGPHNP